MSSQNEIEYQQLQHQEPKGLLISKVESTGTRDAVYCQCLARRCVARAALHLGITTMDNESLDVLASCLLEYITRIGEMTSHTAEAAGRSSAHCNVLDILNAVALSTSRTAATAVQSASSDFYPELLESVSAAQFRSSAAGGASTAGDGYNSSWKQLAIFCFGPDWNESPSSSNNLASDQTPIPRTQAASSESLSSLGGGKVGPNSVLDPYNNGTNNDGTRKQTAGWKAPFPEEVPAFPICGKQVANPHPLEPPSLHATFTDDNPEAVPLSMYQVSHFESSKPNASEGVSKETELVGGKRKAVEKDDSGMEGPVSKKIKISHDMDAGKRHPAVSTTDQSNFSFLPTFYPPLPNVSKSRAVLDVTASRIMKHPKESASTAKGADSVVLSSSTSVRSTLVELGEYWGSRSEDDVPLQNVRVLPGRSSVPATAGAPSIVPLGRASGSRVSRILEGSMDAAP